MTSSNALLLVMVAALLATSRALFSIPWPYAEDFYGDATYYGVTANGVGNCAIHSPLPAMYDGMLPVALNDAQVFRRFCLTSDPSPVLAVMSATLEEGGVFVSFGEGLTSTSSVELRTAVINSCVGACK